MSFKSGRGGARQGAGRPKGVKNPTYLSDDVRRQTFGTRLPGWMVKRLKAEQEPASKIIEKALMQYWGIKTKKGGK